MYGKAFTKKDKSRVKVSTATNQLQGQNKGYEL